MNRARSLVAGVILASGLALWSAAPIAHHVAAGRQTAASLPASLTDRELWALTEDLSEPNGSFRSDNILSNETQLQFVIPDLLTQVGTGGVYLGVGPEQNFTYMAALKPKMVFIIDVRRGNLQLQLMYKALFELSADRAEFMSRLFTKRRPAGVDSKSTAVDLMNAYWDVRTDDESTFRANLQAIVEQLVRRHRFPLSEDDIAGIEYVYYQFYWFGPSINYSSSTTGNGGGRGAYAQMMTLQDRSGLRRGYLESEENFTLLKDLESKNLVVPLVGNFAGPKAIRAVGRYLRERGATVSAFYLSNVEQYLYQDNLWSAFCANAATLPMTERSVFIRSRGGQSIGNMMDETKPCGGRSRPGRAAWRWAK